MSTPKERPILMCAEMVRAVLTGTKVQTRRVVTPQPEMVVFESDSDPVPAFPRKLCAPGFEAIGVKVFNAGGNDGLVICPHGKSGDRIWIKETFYAINPGKAYYRADGEILGYKWKPSIFMPRALSRITLEIVSVRVERVQDISPQDAKAEGVTPNCRSEHLTHEAACFIEAYERLWDNLNFKRGFGWSKNPWCWCLTFRRVP